MPPPAPRPHKIEASLDRFREAHYWIHMLEQHYHESDLFRWYLSAFLKAMKEVPQLLANELQNEDGFKEWFAPHREQLHADPLICHLAKQRNVVVHRGMLLPGSSCMVGVTEPRGMRLGIGVKADPREDSDTVMERFFRSLSKNNLEGLLVADSDSVPCVKRTWKLASFDGEVVEFCAKAWLRLGGTINAVLQWLQEDVPPLSIDCLHAQEAVQFKLYDRDELIQRLKHAAEESA